MKPLAVCMVAISVMIAASASYAQELAPAAPAMKVPVPMTAPAAPPSNFPKLPVSKPCKKEQVMSIWKMVKLYESPPGAETRDLAAAKLQFLHLSKDTTYKIVKRNRPTRGRRAFRNAFKRDPNGPLQQYVVHKGFIYFYNEGSVIDTQACFIVEKDLGEFKKGQMLLMPPAPQKGDPAPTTRLLKVYKNITPPRRNRNSRRNRR